MLPLLGVKDLAHLSCTCRELKQLVYSSPDAVWENAARHLLPKRHPLEHPATRTVVQQTLQAFAAATRNVSKGIFQLRDMPATAACFSATGSHVAVVHEKQILFFATDCWECIATFEAGEDAEYQYAQWAPHGTIGLLTVQKENGSVLVRYGDLVASALEANPFDSLTSIVVPDFSSYDCKAFTTSPDLTKVFLAKERPVGFAPGVSRPQTLCTVMDTRTGAALWEKALGVTAEYHLVCNAIVWHSDSDTFFHSVHGPRRMGNVAGLLAVTLSTGATDSFDAGFPLPGSPSYDNLWRATNIAVCPEGNWLGMCLHFQKGPWQRALLHWPTKQVYWLITELSLNENCYWDWAGVQCAFVNRHPPDIHTSSLCVVKQAAAISPAASNSDGPPESAIIVLDATSPEFTQVARLPTPAGFYVRRFEWSADSAILCAICFNSATDSNGRGSYRYSADRVESCVCLYCFTNR
ncbi:hypothetical protein WJX73_007508 [Symbiochloris irregularis]|uniref:F-box domain-containing protein n=1 Tax=Symbiochloris irregularis TaxID=706552 RepID=A0AAW1P1E1_9CHLO